jgi:hypothetical protein
MSLWDEKRRIKTRSVVSSRWKIALWIAGGAALAIVAALVIVSVMISRRARVWVQDSLTHEFNSKVELSSFSIAVPFPLVQGEGENLALHFQGREDLPPLIVVKRFIMRTSIWGLIRASHHISYVQLEGLEINVPPREVRGDGGGANGAMRKIRAVRFDDILSENATLRILTSKPGKDPLEFHIEHLRLNSNGSEGALVFRATLTNPMPPGEIVSTGIFGPWNADSPSETPVSGDYTFEKADLGVFPGIAGILSSKGDYQGVLGKIAVDGTTDTPDFRVTLANHPVDLYTTFHATVDGTDGDTYLQHVEAHFGHTDLQAQGSVERAKGTHGKTITLDVSASRARVEDLLLLAVKASPPMTGPVRLKTKFILKPGPQQIPDRIYLDGSFTLDSLHFTSSSVQQKVDNMSKRSEGKPGEVVNPADAISEDDVATAMKSDFRVQNGTLTLSGLNFVIPGAAVQLAGDYGLEAQTLDLYGKLIMQAKLSQTTTGVKSFLLRFADPIFSKGGKGTVLPITITGPVQHPHYGLDLRHKAESARQNSN